MLVRMVRVPDPEDRSVPAPGALSTTGFVRSSVLPAILEPQLEVYGHFARPRVLWAIVPLGLQMPVVTASRFGRPSMRSRSLWLRHALRKQRRQTHIVLGFQAQQPLFFRRRQIKRGDEFVHGLLVHGPPARE